MLHFAGYSTLCRSVTFIPHFFTIRCRSARRVIHVAVYAFWFTRWFTTVAIHAVYRLPTRTRLVVYRRRLHTTDTRVTVRRLRFAVTVYYYTLHGYAFAVAGHTARAGYRLRVLPYMTVAVTRLLHGCSFGYGSYYLPFAPFRPVYLLRLVALPVTHYALPHTTHGWFFYLPLRLRFGPILPPRTPCHIAGSPRLPHHHRLAVAATPFTLRSGSVRMTPGWFTYDALPRLRTWLRYTARSTHYRLRHLPLPVVYLQFCLVPVVVTGYAWFTVVILVTCRWTHVVATRLPRFVRILRFALHTRVYIWFGSAWLVRVTFIRALHVLVTGYTPHLCLLGSHYCLTHTVLPFHLRYTCSLGYALVGYRLLPTRYARDYLPFCRYALPLLPLFTTRGSFGCWFTTFWFALTATRFTQFWLVVLRRIYLRAYGYYRHVYPLPCGCYAFTHRLRYAILPRLRGYVWLRLPLRTHAVLRYTVLRYGYTHTAFCGCCYTLPHTLLPLLYRYAAVYGLLRLPAFTGSLRRTRTVVTFLGCHTCRYRAHLSACHHRICGSAALPTGLRLLHTVPVGYRALRLPVLPRCTLVVLLYAVAFTGYIYVGYCTPVTVLPRSVACVAGSVPFVGLPHAAVLAVGCCLALLQLLVTHIYAHTPHTLHRLYGRYPCTHHLLPHGCTAQFTVLPHLLPTTFFYGYVCYLWFCLATGCCLPRTLRSGFCCRRTRSTLFFCGCRTRSRVTFAHVCRAVAHGCCHRYTAVTLHCRDTTRLRWLPVLPYTAFYAFSSYAFVQFYRFSSVSLDYLLYRSVWFTFTHVRFVYFAVWVGCRLPFVGYRSRWVGSVLVAVTAVTTVACLPGCLRFSSRLPFTGLDYTVGSRLYPVYAPVHTRLLPYGLLRSLRYILPTYTTRTYRCCPAVTIYLVGYLPVTVAFTRFCSSTLRTPRLLLHTCSTPHHTHVHAPTCRLPVLPLRTRIICPFACHTTPPRCSSLPDYGLVAFPTPAHLPHLLRLQFTFWFLTVTCLRFAVTVWFAFPGLLPRFRTLPHLPAACTFGSGSHSVYCCRSLVYIATVPYVTRGYRLVGYGLVTHFTLHTFAVVPRYATVMPLPVTVGYWFPFAVLPGLPRLYTFAFTRFCG